jgi:hypothetical protein
MGQEITCVARVGNKEARGNALLETSELLFRPMRSGPGKKPGAVDPEMRLRIPFSQMKSVKADHGTLQVKFADGVAAFRLGAYAEKWRDKILHPKSRIEKLGVKPGANVSVIGNFPAEFIQELLLAAQKICDAKIAADANSIFLAAESLADLAGVEKMAKQMPPAAALWIVYPKGQKAITENDVIAAGRKAGLKDVKVVAFSATHTTLKFVTPLDQR